MTSTAAAPAVTSEYHTRLWMGLVLALAAAGILVVDHLLERQFGQRLFPYPCLFVCVAALVVLAVLELHALLVSFPRPPLWLSLAGCLALSLVGWPGQMGVFGPPDPYRDLTWLFGGLVLAGFLYEMAVFREPGQALQRLPLFVWTVAYLGLLPAFLVRLRWWPPAEGASDLRGVAALALVIFVPKGCDIGAYFTGRWLGRHKMTPLLSPKKTWEGLAGGLVLSMLVAVAVNRLVAPVLSGDLEAAAFGFVIGLAGVYGDLAESLIKRECRQKDASHVVPGFGGVLDVVDSVLFAAPAACWWLL